jgi:uncharacterized membrane protein
MGLLLDLVIASLLALPMLAFAALVWLVVRLRRLESRISALERNPPGAVSPEARSPTRPAPVERDAAPAAEPLAPREPLAREIGPRAARRPPAPQPPPAPVASKRTRASARSVEERIVRAAVWGAAIVLALAGIFLVQWSFERGWLGPLARVTLGVVFGATLLALGQFARTRSARVAAAMIAAGIAVLYASFLAGTTLYGLISAPIGFALIALVTFAAVALSLRHGPIIALVGLVGGLLTPALIGSEDAGPLGLFLYLILVQAGLLLVVRRRSWWALAPIAVTGGMLWAAFWIVGTYEHSDVFVIGPFLLTSGLLAVLGATNVPGRTEQWFFSAPAVSAWIGVGGAAVLASAMAWVGRMSVAEWVFFAIVGVGCLLLARRDPAYAPLAWLAPTLGAVLIWLWGMNLSGPQTTEIVSESGRLGLTAAALGTLFVAVAYAFLWGSARPQQWAWIVSSTGVVYLAIAWMSVHTLGPPWWGVIAIALGTALTAAALPLARLRRSGVEWNPPLAALAAGATLAVSLAAPMELERQWISVAWAIEVALLAWVYDRLRVNSLVVIGCSLTAAVALRLLANPLVLTYPIGDGAVLNWLSYGYGVPLVSMLVAARLLRRAGVVRAAPWHDAVAVALGFALLTALVRHYFNPVMSAFDMSLREAAAYSIVWLGYSLVLLATETRALPPVVARTGSQLSAIAGLSASGIGSCLLLNPVLIEQPVGATPLVNALVVIYGVPAALLLALGRAWSTRGNRLPALVSWTSALVLALLLVTLEVRHAFHGSVLAGGVTSDREWYAYSAAWLVSGLALLTLGIVKASGMLRYASLAVMLVVVMKVFLFDMSELQGLLRVFSFLGLGISLLLLALGYQRFVFRRQL